MAEKITLKSMLANLPQKTDVGTVVGRDSSGNPVYIKKSDLAQVVAELINPALLKGPITATDDNLAVAVDGIFSLTQPSAASTGPNDHGLLMSLRINNTNGYIQIMFSIRGKIYSRFKSSSGVWSKWSVFTGVNYIP